MSAEIHQLYIPPNSPTPEPKIADVYRDQIDVPNAEREARQLSAITHVELMHDGREFDLVTYTPTDGLRTFNDSEGNSVNYPELLLVHGVASDARFFDPHLRSLNKLGVRGSAVTLPRQSETIPDADSLLEWQVEAVIVAYEEILRIRPDAHIIIGGHSRGGIVATEAKRRIKLRYPDDANEGLLLLAPAGLDTYRPKSLGKAALNLVPLAFNSLRHSDSKRLVGMYALMIAQVVIANPGQTVVEIWQALHKNVDEVLFTDLSDTSVFIPVADEDEFIDHKRIIEVAELAPADNISVATLNTNHMMGSRGAAGIISLSDPRLLPGQILSWMQSQTEGYTPLTVNAATGRTARLTSRS
jgi:pimeloyl-ACP methyl ester carboxylesterase